MQMALVGQELPVANDRSGAGTSAWRQAEARTCLVLESSARQPTAGARASSSDLQPG